MTNWKPYPEISIADRDDLSATWIVDGKGEVIAIDTNGDTAALERLVQCWNACRKIEFPENHIPATDDYLKRLEQLRKDAVAMAGTGEGPSWNFDLSAAPKDGKVWLASNCGKVIPTYWDKKREQWAGFATNGTPPVAWQPYVVPVHPNAVSDLGLNIVTKHSEVAA